MRPLRIVALAAGFLPALAPFAASAEFPAIREIVYEGNGVTQPVTMDRERVVAVGDGADPQAIERSRQAIQDLGLFREVKVREEPLEDGGVRLVFVVREKWYVLPIPRLEINSDGDTGYGMQLRWNNLWGLNHRLELLGVRRDYKRQDRDDSTNFHLNYDIPFLGDSRNALNLSASHAEQDSTEGGVSFRERSDRFGFGVSRALAKGPASQGWKIGAGLAWSEQETMGLGAPPSYGVAVSPSLSVSYRNQRDHIFSETGTSFGSAIGFAAEGALSDYGYFSHYSYASRELSLGQREHQTLRFAADMAGYHAGPVGREPDAFEFGGSTRLRGYDREIIDGDFAYYGTVEYLRPLHWNWLRGLANLEIGSALDDLNDTNSRVLHASAGLGMRVRVTWLVRVELELGVAYPLIEGDGLRFFARAL